MVLGGPLVEKVARGGLGPQSPAVDTLGPPC